MGCVTVVTRKSLVGTYTADGDVTYLGPAEPRDDCLDTVHLRYADCGKMMLGQCGVELSGGVGFFHNIHCKGFCRNIYC